MSSLLTWFRPTFDAIFSTLPFRYRWRLLCFQPLQLLINSMCTVPLLLSRRFSVLYIPTRDDRKVRALVFQPPNRATDTRLRPLHLDIHAGGFIGGLPEANARFCSRLSDETGAVVVSPTYRFSPRHRFPAAIDDIDDVLDWLLKNAKFQLGADPTLLTTGGNSAGANLAIAACQQASCHLPAATAIKGVVVFYAPVDLRIPPEEKPRPAKFPSWDPLWWMNLLYDSYAGEARPTDNNNPRLHPIVADIETLPEDMLFIVPMIDILVHEQLTFVERLNRDIAKMTGESDSRKVWAVTFEKCFHGWLEVPSFTINERTRTEAFDLACTFISEVHRKHGFQLKAV